MQANHVETDINSKLKSNLKRTGNLSEYLTDKTYNPSYLDSQKPYLETKGDKELEELASRFTGSKEKWTTIDKLVDISRKLKTEEEASLLSRYLSVLDHSVFNNSILANFIEEVEQRTKDYMTRNPPRGAKTYGKRKFSNSLTTIQDYVNIETDKPLKKQRSERFSHQLEKKDSYELLLYALALDMPNVVINTWDENMVSEYRAKSIVGFAYHDFKETHKGIKLYQAIRERFQERTKFSLNNQQVKDFIPRQIKIEQINEEKKITLVPDRDMQSQNYA